MTTETTAPAAPVTTDDAPTETTETTSSPRFSTRARIITAAALAALLVAAGGILGGVAYADAQALAAAQTSYASVRAQLHAQVDSSVHAGKALDLRKSSANTLSTTVTGILAAPAGSLDPTTSAATKTSLDALAKVLTIEGSPTLAQPADLTTPATTAALVAATKSDRALRDARAASIAKTDAAASAVASAVDNTLKALTALATGNAATADAFFAANPLAGADEQAAFKSAEQALATGDAGDALTKYVAAAVALQNSQAAGAAAQAAAAAAAASHSSGSTHHSSGSGGGSAGGSGGGGTGGGSGGGTTQVPAKFTTNSHFVASFSACNGSYYLSHTVGYGGTSTASQSAPFTTTAWTATVSGPTVTYYICG